ncbi:hypothetical protein HGRIS_000235 [Hohenbuehelia grisea]|uniref:MYND-type domain-containing protein n=1 Tax=Hohenbuehelia grisea TaxID=104357 RepID=A0ABR3JRC6_9AGAR
MPGPGRKGAKGSKSKSSRPRTTASSDSSSNAYFGDVDGTDRWDEILRYTCVYFDIPDLWSRHGLKKVHANFDSIHERLDSAYLANPGNDKVVGAIISVYTKMSADAILRDKIFHRGFMQRLLPLLEMDNCRHLALRALTTFTHHGGTKVRAGIAKDSASTLVKLIDRYPDDPKVAEKAIITLCHSVIAVVGTWESSPPNPQTLRDIDMPGVLRVVTDTLKKPTTSSDVINHAIELIASSTLHCSEMCKANPTVLKFLVGGFRSKDWIFRAMSLGGLIRVPRKEAEEDTRLLDPHAMMNGVQRGFPMHISEIMTAYGPPKCDIYLTLSAMNLNTKAFMKCGQDHDLYSLGITLANLIPTTEFSITQGGFQAEDPQTGRVEFMDIGLPFKMWGDALPHCAKAIRAKGKPEELDLADFLDIKDAIMKGRIPQVVELARKALERSPDQAYFYYAQTLAAAPMDGLRTAKKGSKCKKITPFLRFQMLQRAVEHASELGMKLLQDSGSVDKDSWELGVAFLTSALEDARTFLDNAPPDNRYIKNMAYWHILLTATCRGPELSDDLSELEDTFMKLKFAEEVGTFLGLPPPKTYLRLAQQHLIKLWPTAIKEWKDVTERYDHDMASETPPTEKNEDELAAWLQDTHIEPDEHGDTRFHRVQSTFNSTRSGLYRCSWCGNPSAVLRKCGGCEQARYCDASCQRSHWKEHKSKCSRART